jgi:alanyl-tRNA synthetase
MKSAEVRQKFLDFFKSKQHKIVPSAPLINRDDPTLMFSNSGMVQFKDFFLGNKVPSARRIADTQKCLRVSGKHNDLEDVGFDGTHHTLFEMLGNWSFGDYFKTEAIAWSWELLTEVYKLPKDRLYATVFGGDTAENLDADTEAKNIWLKYLPANHILYGNKKDNFWEMGSQGPCGPCSEIHIDLRTDAERAKTKGEDLVNQDHPRVVEIWNNVFMQFERRADKSLIPLPSKHVDTGMGFERLCMAMQGKLYTYDTDVFTPFITLVEKITNHSYTGSYDRAAKKDVAFRVIVDHIRAVAFSIADGQMPMNTGAGYVIRRILRRAVRYYYSFLDSKEPLLYQLIPLLAKEFATVFPELKQQEDFVSKVILEEERSFLRTLEGGLRRLEQITVENNVLDTQTAFELFDTYGFPFDLTALIASEKGWTVDENGFKAALEEQKKRSRENAIRKVGDWTVLDEVPSVQFVGYDQLRVDTAHVLKYRLVEDKKGFQYQIVLNRTPFYAEGGGQVGDTGWMYFDGEKIAVTDTKKENELIIHFVEKLPLNIHDATVRCQVDVERRRHIENNHSATHLLHAALRQVLGTHVAQRGSLVNDNYLRFDFAHYSKVEDAQLLEIEQIVNHKIRENIALGEQRNLPIAQAKESGAMMLFGEKYGDTVRMITFDPKFSKELCGGCHVSATGKIGTFKITAETGTSSGVRRIEALTGSGAEAFLNEESETLKSIKQLLKNPKDVLKAIGSLQDEIKKLQKENEHLMAEKATLLQSSLKSQVEMVKNVHFISTQITLTDANVVKNLAYNLERELGNAVIVLGTINAGKPQITIRISDNLVKTNQLHAGNMVRTLAKNIKGGGGGQPFFATAGGTDVTGLADALLQAKELLN